MVGFPRIPVSLVHQHAPSVALTNLEPKLLGTSVHGRGLPHSRRPCYKNSIAEATLLLVIGTAFKIYAIRQV